MSIETKQIREGHYRNEDGQTFAYRTRILAVAERKDGGRLVCPILDFFHAEFRNPNRERLTALIERTARLGPTFVQSQFKPVEGTVFYEFKAFQLRLFCFFDGGNLIICTHGTVKKKDQIDPSDIKIASRWHSLYHEAKTDQTLRHELLR